MKPRPIFLLTLVLGLLLATGTGCGSDNCSWQWYCESIGGDLTCAWVKICSGGDVTPQRSPRSRGAALELLPGESWDLLVVPTTDPAASLTARFVGEEAARSLGKSRLGALRTITVPLLARGIAAGALLVFLTTMKELPITLLARPTGFDTLAVDVWSAAGELLYSHAAVPAILLLAASAVPTFVLATRQR